MEPEGYISVDIEAAGPIPGEFSMLSVGACFVYNLSNTFYAELKPINKNFHPEALKVAGFSLEELEQTGEMPDIAMRNFESWIKKSKGRPVFVGFNATFDWQFINYYFVRFLGRNPFGISGLDIKAYYMGKFGKNWAETSKSKIPNFLKSGRQHTHNALDDAMEQAELFRNIITVRL